MKCKAIISRRNERLARTHIPCDNASVKDGFCTIHHPSYESIKDQRRWEKIKYNKCMMVYERLCADAVKAISNGHPDPIGLCKKLSVMADSKAIDNLFKSYADLHNFSDEIKIAIKGE